MTFSCKMSEVKFYTTRRGINATAKIRDEKGVHVATLDDVAESIVAHVDFYNGMTPETFLGHAHAAGFRETSECFTISEFARSILEAAEAKYRGGA